MKCYEQGIQKHLTITFTMSPQKADLRYNLSLHFQHFQRYSKTTSYSI